MKRILIWSLVILFFLNHLTPAFAEDVSDREPKVYGNIFSICGKMDPVTNIPFADWGYSRYGITFFTPAMETDSAFWTKRKKADQVYKELTGISGEENIKSHHYLAALYIIAGTALVVTSFTHSARVSRGSFLLFTAGILIVLNTAWGNSFFFHFGSAALHYIAVCILASAGSGFTLPSVVPEYAAETE